MQFVWRRYARSGYAPMWYYALIAIGFTGLVAWAIVEQDWLVATIALVLLPVTLAGAWLMRRMKSSLDLSAAQAPATSDQRPATSDRP